MLFSGHTKHTPCLSKTYPKENISADEPDVNQQEIK